MPTSEHTAMVESEHTPAVGGSSAAWSPDRSDSLLLLEEAAIDDCGLIPWGSNYTFLVTLDHPVAGESFAIYKPQRGEAPLYDFPEGSLYRRERAAYLLSEALGWGLVPPTVIRDGPYGIGMVQLYIDADTAAHYFTFGGEIETIARRIALFDLIVNNADRKAGHVLRDPGGRVWAIDHGLTFHSAEKIRTVIWDFAGESIDESALDDLDTLLASLHDGGHLAGALDGLVSARECAALRARITRLRTSAVYPHPTSYRSMPWPAV